LEKILLVLIMLESDHNPLFIILSAEKILLLECLLSHLILLEIGILQMVLMLSIITLLVSIMLLLEQMRFGQIVLVHLILQLDGSLSIIILLANIILQMVPILLLIILLVHTIPQFDLVLFWKIIQEVIIRLLDMKQDAEQSITPIFLITLSSDIVQDMVSLLVPIISSLDTKLEKLSPLERTISSSDMISTLRLLPVPIPSISETSSMVLE